MPAVAGGVPVRDAFLPYGLHSLGPQDEQAVLDVLRHGWLTAGPKVVEFERAFAEYVGASHAVAVATGTAALHLTLLGLNVGPRDEVITSPLTFVATANAIVHAGATPVFADVDAGTLNIDPARAAAKLSRKTKVLLPVHFAGAPCDLPLLRKVAAARRAAVVEDACHAVGAAYGTARIGAGRDAQCFSFHPVKNMTTAEGAIVTTPHNKLADRLRSLRFHGFREDYLTRSKRGALGYPRMHLLGFKSIMSDLQAALGLSQLTRLAEFNERRAQLAERYQRAFGLMDAIECPSVLPGTTPSWHIYVIRLRLDRLKCSRDEFMYALQRENIGTSVHYMPVHLQPYYRKRFGFRAGLCPIAEDAYRRMITLPLFPKMTDADHDDVILAVDRLVRYYRR